MTREHTVSGLGHTELDQSDQIRISDEASRAATEAPGASDPRGSTIGRFTVLETLGSGGMGVVYAAYDPNLDRKVALKLLSTPVSGSDEARIRMLREAQAMARIDHPNVLRVFEAGELDDQIYIAMEFAGGGTLKRWLAAEPRTRAQILEVFAQAGRGLAAAHAAGLIHRDFKPDNVMLLGDGSARVSDFGLVGMIGDKPAAAAPHMDVPLSEDTPLSRDLTRTGALMGTPNYMAPEQFRGQHVGAAADQFAFCVALYDALCKQKPFEGTTFAELCANVVSGSVRPIPREAHVSSRVGNALMRGLAIDPAKRFASMTALLDALDDRPRHRGVLAGAGVLVVAGGVAAFAMLVPHVDACGGAGARLATTWNPASAALLAETFTLAPRPDAKAVLDRVVPIFDRWNAAWEQGYIGACEDTRVRAVQSEHLLDLRMECLSRRLDDERAVLVALGSGGVDAVEHAFDVANTLPDVDACANTAALVAGVEPPAPVANAAVAATRAKITSARAQRELGHYKIGRELATAALREARALGYQPAIAEATLELGTVQRTLADKAAAQTFADAMYAQTLAFASKQLGDNNPLTISVVSYTAVLQADEHHYEAARASFQRVADADRELYGTDHPEYAKALDNLANIDSDTNHTEGALQLRERALAIRIAALGAQHPEVAGSYIGLGDIAYEAGQLVKAKQYFEQALAIVTKQYGDASVQLDTALIDLGNTLARLGDRAKAREVLNHALANEVAAWSAEDPRLGETLQNLGVVERDDRNYDAALAQFERAHRITEAAFGSKDPRASAFLGEIANTYTAMNKLPEAKVATERAIAALIASTGERSTDTATELANEGLLDFKLGDNAGALAALQRAAAIFEEVVGKDHPSVAICLIAEGEAFDRLQRYSEAIAVLDRAEQIANGKDFAPSDLGDLHSFRGDALYAAPATRARGRDEVKAALALYEKANATDDVERVKQWLRKH